MIFSYQIHKIRTLPE